MLPFVCVFKVGDVRISMMSLMNHIESIMVLYFKNLEPALHSLSALTGALGPSTTALCQRDKSSPWGSGRVPTASGTCVSCRI